MYSNGGGQIAEKPKTDVEKVRQPINADGRPLRNGKCFVRCICPKCNDRHNVYMRWAGRGVPRKYCSNCRPLIAGYDGTAVSEAAMYVLGQTRKKRQRQESE